MKTTLLLVQILLCVVSSYAQMQTRVLANNLFIPWELVFGPDQHIWFTQKNGYICRLNPTTQAIDTLYFESNTVIQNEGGMLGMTLHPNFPTTPYVFVAYNYLDNSVYKERIVRYTYNSIANSLQSPLIILDNVNAASIHNGCRLTIVVDKLFITTGDGSVMSRAQDVTSLNGKTLRINLDGSIPADNPIPGSPVWSWGHRNAQGMVYANSRLYQSEHGANSDDEINIDEKGRNFGWPDVQGFCNTPAEMTFCTDSNVVEPLNAWTPTLAVSDIDYYSHPMFPSFQQSLIMATLKDQRLYRLKLNSTLDDIDSVLIIPNINFGRLRSVCVGTNGNIFISTSNSNADGSTIMDRIIEIFDPSFVPASINNSDNDNNITIYPNPANNVVNIDIALTNDKNLSYKVFDLTGRQIGAGKLKGQNSINISSYPSGAYFLSVFGGNYVITTQKIFKQKE